MNGQARMIVGKLPLLSLCLAGFFLSAGCGGGKKEQSGPQAGPSSPARAAVPGESAPPPESNPAEKRFADLTREIDKLGAGESIDRAWLEKELDQVLKDNPKHSAALFNRAALRERDGDKAGARKIYEQILDNDPDFAPASENLAVALVEEGKVDDAIGIYRKNIERDPKNVTSRLGLARILATRKQYEDAITLCRQALQRQADAIEAFRVLALSYDALGNVPMAELIIGRGLKVSENDLELHYLLAEILMRKKDLAGGVNELKRIVKMDPKWLKVRAQLAEIAISYRDFGGAAQQLEAITKEEPNNRNAANNLAVAYKGMGRFEQAEGIYKKLLQANDKDADVLWNAAVLYHRHLNRFDDAIAMYQRAKSAAKSGDERFADIDKLIAEADRQKNDIADRQAREERERKKLAAIEAACTAVREGKKPDGDAIGNDQERVEVAWQLVVNGQAMIQQGDIAGGEQVAKCGFAVVPDTQAAKTEVCAPMRVMWAAQVLYPLGRLDDALTTTGEALECDPANPDAQLIKQQLQELIAQQKAAQAAGAAPEGAAPAPGAPTP